MNTFRGSTKSFAIWLRKLNPRQWPFRYKLQIMITLCSLILLGVLTVCVFWVQKRSLIRQAEANMALITDARAGRVEDYFRNVRNQIVTFAANSIYTEALQSLSASFDDITNDFYYTENAGSAGEMNSALLSYYASEILPGLSLVSGDQMVPENFISTQEQSVLQYLYIVENPRPGSQKYTMTKASDGSTYSSHHGNIHPEFLSSAGKAGISDLILVDYKTGNVVYTLKKNIDFATNLYHGPFSSSGLSAAYLRAVAAGVPGSVIMTEPAAYLPAMMEPTYFVSAPMMSGDMLIGAVIFAIDGALVDQLLMPAMEEQSATIRSYFRIGSPDDYVQLINTTSTGEMAWGISREMDINGLNGIIITQMAKRDMMAPARRIVWIMCGISLLLLFGILVFGGFVNLSVYRPLQLLKSSMEKLNNGTDIENINPEEENELGQLALTFNSLNSRVRELLNFSRELGKENYNVSLEERHAEDEFGKTMNALKNNLIRKKEAEEKRAREDEIRNWSTDGIAKFNDLLRLDNDNLDKLSLNIIRNLIQYLKANQGGLFLLEGEDDDRKLNLVASIAFDRQKFHTKSIEVGEGLAGSCVLEKQTIVVNKLPEDYIEITSGLGGARPGSLVIVPLKKDDTVYGVIELASFNAFEQHEVAFIEKVAEGITDTIINVRLNIQNVQLLERFQQQAEEMKAQDEELRQNIEELQTTHEQIERMKEQEKEKTDKFIQEIENNRQLLLNVMDQIPGKIFVKDHNGVLLLLNSEVARVYNKKVDELIGTSDFDNHTHEEATEYRQKELEVLEKGGEKYIQEESLTGEKRFLETTKKPFYLPHLGTTGLLGIQIDVTDYVKMEQQNKEKEEELRQNIEELKSTQEQIDQLKQAEIEQKETMLKQVEDNQKLLLSVLDEIPGKIFVKDHNGVLLLLNSEVARVYNKKVDELIGTSDFDNHTYEEATEYRKKELEVLEKGGEKYIQEESLTGETRFLETTKKPFHLPHLGTTGLLGIQIDVTDYLRMEQENREKEEELRQNIEELKSTQEQIDQLKQAEIEQKEEMLKKVEDNRKLLISVLDHIPGKIFVKDHNGVLLLLNSEVARVYSKKVEELIGTSDFDNHPEKEARVYRAKEVEIMKKGAETYIQEESLTGEKRYLKTTKMPFKISTTGKTGIMGFQIDVTETTVLKDKVVRLKKELDDLKKG